MNDQKLIIFFSRLRLPTSCINYFVINNIIGKVGNFYVFPLDNVSRKSGMVG